MNYGSFMFGVFIGMVFLGLLLALTHRTYRQTLLCCAKFGTPERLPDNNLYFLVEKDKYNKIAAFKNALRQVQCFIIADTYGGDSEHVRRVNTARKKYLDFIDKVSTYPLDIDEKTGERLDG